jgi:SARP family transcriptional regulator, regulator of embCAB operon
MRIQLCGRLKVDADGHHVTPHLRGKQGRALLAYLVLNRGREVTRDELIEAIWPGEKPINPSAALRTQLSHLRRAIGSDALAGRDTVELRLPENVWVDVEAADAAIVAAERSVADEAWRDAWIQAHITLNIAGRPLLGGFEAEWVDQARGDLVELELRARDAIARAGIGLGGSELATAERSARAMIRTAPYRESGYLLLMEALAAAGKTTDALLAYEGLRRNLREQLGTDPGPELQALHRRLMA